MTDNCVSGAYTIAIVMYAVEAVSTGIHKLGNDVASIQEERRAIDELEERIILEHAWDNSI